MPTLSTERRGKGWRFIITVPKELLSHYPSRFLRKTVPEPDRVKADKIAYRWAAEVAAEFRRIKETGSPLKRTISDAKLEQLTGLMVASILGADEESPEPRRPREQ